MVLLLGRDMKGSVLLVTGRQVYLMIDATHLVPYTDFCGKTVHYGSGLSCAAALLISSHDVQVRMHMRIAYSISSCCALVV